MGRDAQTPRHIPYRVTSLGTCLTASILNSSVYRLPLIRTSSVAVNYGSKMSTIG